MPRKLPHATRQNVPLMVFGKTGDNGLLVPRLAEVESRCESDHAWDHSTAVWIVLGTARNPRTATISIVPLMVFGKTGDNGLSAAKAVAKECDRGHEHVRVPSMAVNNVKGKRKRMRHAKRLLNAPLTGFGRSGLHRVNVSTASRLSPVSANRLDSAV